MHFVSAQTQDEQISDIVTFMQENMRESLSSNSSSGAFENFEDDLQKLSDSQNYAGILDLLLSVKSEILQLPTSHKNSALTI